VRPERQSAHHGHDISRHFAVDIHRTDDRDHVTLHALVFRHIHGAAANPDDVTLTLRA